MKQSLDRSSLLNDRKESTKGVNLESHMSRSVVSAERPEGMGGFAMFRKYCLDRSSLLNDRKRSMFYGVWSKSLDRSSLLNDRKVSLMEYYRMSGLDRSSLLNDRKRRGEHSEHGSLVSIGRLC